MKAKETRTRSLSVWIDFAISCPRVRLDIHGIEFVVYLQHDAALAARRITACGQQRPRQRALQASLIILRRMSAARHPNEGPLHDPAAVRNREPFCVSTAIPCSRRRPWRWRSRSKACPASFVRQSDDTVYKILARRLNFRSSSKIIIEGKAICKAMHG